jgi:hypothetical protein
VTLNPSELDRSKIQALGYEKIEVNQVPKQDTDIVIADVQHEGGVPDRWPTDIIIIGDILSKWAKKKSIGIMGGNVTNHVVSYLEETYFGDEDGADT